MLKPYRFAIDASCRRVMASQLRPAAQYPITLNRINYKQLSNGDVPDNWRRQNGTDTRPLSEGIKIFGQGGLILRVVAPGR